MIWWGLNSLLAHRMDWMSKWSNQWVINYTWISHSLMLLEPVKQKYLLKEKWERERKKKYVYYNYLQHHNPAWHFLWTSQYHESRLVFPLFENHQFPLERDKKTDQPCLLLLLDFLLVVKETVMSPWWENETWNLVSKKLINYYMSQIFTKMFSRVSL